MTGLGLSLAAWASAQQTPPPKPTTASPKPATAAAAPPARAAGPRLVQPAATQPIPPAERAKIEKGVADLEAAVDALKPMLQTRADLAPYLADVQIYLNAVRYPLKYNEPIDPKKAAKAVADGLERAAALKAGTHPWTAQSGPRGYVSKIDGSVQPYVLWVPPAYKPGQKEPLPLALSCHGRNEKLTELEFVSSKAGEGNAGNSTVGDPKAKFVAYLYGRYCCANKLAGEVDLFETWDRVAEQYPIDKARVGVTGFSMGGGAVWHLAAHYGSDWVSATPGAGFSESQKFLRLEKNGEVPPWYESALYHLYNATDHAANFANYPVIAYAGEKDGQKQAGDVMEEAMAAEGLKLERFIGPDTAHKYEPKTKALMDARVEEIYKAGKTFMPERVRFNTYTLRYDTMLWVTVTGLEKHWVKGVVDARLDGGKTVRVTTANVSSLYLKFPTKPAPFPAGTPVTVVIDDQKVPFPEDAATVGMFGLYKVGGKWTTLRPDMPKLVKRHGLQGPIDDAFLDSFVVVKPTGGGLHDKTAGWAAGECDRAVAQWQKQFRGEARVKDAAAVSDEDVASSNLVLFGDPQSNPLIAKVLAKLPIEWTKEKLLVNGQAFAADRYVPVMVYPNPLNPKRYVVLNSGFTFRENDYLNNARQTPKLPDYAVVDTQTPPGPAGWGTLPKAGFFGERWEWQADDGKVGQ
jgi:hypothetical protein